MYVRIRSLGHALHMDDLVPLDHGSAGPVGYMFTSIYLVKRAPNGDLAPLGRGSAEPV